MIAADGRDPRTLLLDARNRLQFLVRLEIEDFPLDVGRLTTLGMMIKIITNAVKCAFSGLAEQLRASLSKESLPGFRYLIEFDARA